MSAAVAEDSRTSTIVRRTEPEAAGGVVWREGDGEPEVLLVYRKEKHDWTFPKGRREDKETLLETARREVAEETGITPIVLKELAPFSYSLGDERKTVAMFQMLAADTEPTALAGDVTFAMWVPLPVAHALLTHAEQKEYLAALEPPPLRARTEARSRLQAALTSPERARLTAETEVLRSKLAPIAASPRTLVDRAAREARWGDIDAGWKLLHEARRRSFDHLDEATVSVEAIALEQEATEKLSGWRRDAVIALAKVAQEKDNGVSHKRSALVVATRIRDERGDNIYFSNRLLRKQMTPIALILFASLVAFALFERAVIPPMLLGACGACLSALITFARSTTRLKIPDHLANVLVTLMRPLIGAASGLVAYLFLTSGLFKEATHLWYLAFAFGFSERLVLAAVESAEKKP